MAKSDGINRRQFFATTAVSSLCCLAPFSSVVSATSAGTNHTYPSINERERLLEVLKQHSYIVDNTIVLDNENIKAVTGKSDLTSLNTYTSLMNECLKTRSNSNPLSFFEPVESFFGTFEWRGQEYDFGIELYPGYFIVYLDWECLDRVIDLIDLGYSVVDLALAIIAVVSGVGPGTQWITIIAWLLIKIVESFLKDAVVDKLHEYVDFFRDQFGYTINGVSLTCLPITPQMVTSAEPWYS